MGYDERHHYCEIAVPVSQNRMLFIVASEPKLVSSVAADVQLGGSTCRC